MLAYSINLKHGCVFIPLSVDVLYIDMWTCWWCYGALYTQRVSYFEGTGSVFNSALPICENRLVLIFVFQNQTRNNNTYIVENRVKATYYVAARLLSGHRRDLRFIYVGRASRDAPRRHM